MKIETYYKKLREACEQLKEIDDLLFSLDICDERFYGLLEKSVKLHEKINRYQDKLLNC